jgi:FAD/FMN-containing dehydrogenase
MQKELAGLENKMKGLLYYNSTALHQTQLLAYSTDASVYQEKPVAVALPKITADIQQLIKFAIEHDVTLIPRAAGTSLAGQVVGSGIVVDISKHFDKVIEVNAEEKWVRVQPGVIRDDLNKYLYEYGLMFGPETSTANRAMIGGMVGNNSCGLHSIVWGSVRNHLLEVTALLSDGSEVVFKEEELGGHSNKDLKKKIYDGINNLLSEESTKQLIKQQFPKDTVVRRNTGYALDALLHMKPFAATGSPFNLCSLIAGSEGTLVFITEVKLKLIALPPKEIALVCVHCNSIEEALRANIVALKHKPMASELVDRYIMNFTYQHPEFHKNCFFIEGEPQAILMVEFMAEEKAVATAMAEELIRDLKQHGYGFAFPVLYNKDTSYAWEVRKAGLGLLRNMPGRYTACKSN